MTNIYTRPKINLSDDFCNKALVAINLGLCHFRSGFNIIML